MLPASVHSFFHLLFNQCRTGCGNNTESDNTESENIDSNNTESETSTQITPNHKTSTQKHRIIGIEVDQMLTNTK